MSRRDREFTLDRARRLQATSREARRLSIGRVRLNTKTSPPDDLVRIRYRLPRKTAPGSVDVIEPKRHRSVFQASFEELDIPSDDEAAPEDGFLPLHSDPDLDGAFNSSEIWEALTWPVLSVPAEFDDSDPLGNGVALG